MSNLERLPWQCTQIKIWASKLIALAGKEDETSSLEPSIALLSLALA